MSAVYRNQTSSSKLQQNQNSLAMLKLLDNFQLHDSSNVHNAQEKERMEKDRKDVEDIAKQHDGLKVDYN